MGGGSHEVPASIGTRSKLYTIMAVTEHAPMEVRMGT
jgi:hypothetical protein